jgi:hypothetical protein
MKIMPPGLSFKESLRSGYVVLRSDKYMALVRQLPCCACDAPGPSDPHHPHGVGYRGTGTKSPDIWVIPLCRRCHEALHKDRVTWEDEHGSQFEFVALTFAHLWVKGLITFGEGVTA